MIGRRRILAAGADGSAALAITGDLAVRWAGETAFFPRTIEAFEQVAIGGDELTEVCAIQMIEGGATVPVTPAGGTIESDGILSMLVSSIFGGTPVQEAADAAAEELDEVCSA